jgi:hypothetical protein
VGTSNGTFGMGKSRGRSRSSMNWPMPWTSKTPAPSTVNCWKAVRAFETYVTNNRAYIPNYGERYRQGKTIATSFVESAVNQVVSKRFVKKQQMRWTPSRGSPSAANPHPGVERGLAIHPVAVVRRDEGNPRWEGCVAPGLSRSLGHHHPAG